MRCCSLVMGLVVVVVACGGSPAPRGPQVSQAPRGHLAVAAASLRAGGEAIDVSSDGTVRANGRSVGRVHGDGRFLDAKGGLVATLGENGRIVSGDGALLEDVSIAGDGTLTLKGRTIRIEDDGAVSGLGARDQLSVQVSREGRRAAMYVLVLAALSAPAQPSSAQ